MECVGYTIEAEVPPESLTATACSTAFFRVASSLDQLDGKGTTTSHSLHSVHLLFYNSVQWCISYLPSIEVILIFESTAVLYSFSVSKSVSGSLQCVSEHLRFMVYIAVTSEYVLQRPLGSTHSSPPTEDTFWRWRMARCCARHPLLQMSLRCCTMWSRNSCVLSD